MASLQEKRAIQLADDQREINIELQHHLTGKYPKDHGKYTVQPLAKRVQFGNRSAVRLSAESKKPAPAADMSAESASDASIKPVQVMLKGGVDRMVLTITGEGPIAKKTGVTLLSRNQFLMALSYTSSNLGSIDNTYDSNAPCVRIRVEPTEVISVAALYLSVGVDQPVDSVLDAMKSFRARVSRSEALI
ncbi:hypothetical protein HWV62_24640 [Athelia sp. TMB]|nr:hypothetical protein HWV62_24640 [Athelia sp. TMB]